MKPRADAKLEKGQLYYLMPFYNYALSEGEAAASKTLPFLFHFLRLPPAPPADFSVVRKWKGFAPSGGRTEGRERVCACAHTRASRTAVRTERPEAVGYARRAYASRPHHYAIGA